MYFQACSLVDLAVWCWCAGQMRTGLHTDIYLIDCSSCPCQPPQMHAPFTTAQQPVHICFELTVGTAACTNLSLLCSILVQLLLCFDAQCVEVTPVAPMGQGIFLQVGTSKQRV